MRGAGHPDPPSLRRSGAQCGPVPHKGKSRPAPRAQGPRLPRAPSRRYDAPMPDHLPASRWSPRVVAPRLPGLLAGLVLFGIGIALIGTSTNVAMNVLPAAGGLPAQLAMMAAGVVTIAIGSGLYLASDLGPGPRDGLMTGLHLRFGWSIRRARTAIELTVLVAGFLAGGTIGLGTVVFALAIGPLVQVALRVFDRDGRVSRRRRAVLEARGTLGE